MGKIICSGCDTLCIKCILCPPALRLLLLVALLALDLPLHGAALLLGGHLAALLSRHLHTPLHLLHLHLHLHCTCTHSSRATSSHTSRGTTLQQHGVIYISGFMPSNVMHFICTLKHLRCLCN